MALRIAVVVSTVWTNREKFVAFFERNRAALERFDEVALAIQGCPPGAELPLFEKPSRFIFELNESRGLSANRNTSMRLCTAEFAWILDDDVVIEPDAYDSIRKALSSHPSWDVVTFEFSSLEERKIAKKYPCTGPLGSLELLRVSSIEIVISTAFLRGREITFNTRYGLGGYYPSGEETVLLLDCADAGAKIGHVARSVVLHPQAERRIRKFWSIRPRLYGMGTIARRFGLTGFVLIARWALRAIFNRVPARPVMDLFRGYFRGDRLADG